MRNVEAAASWRGGARIPLDRQLRPALEALIADRDEDGDGRIGLPTWVNLFEDGIVIRQRPDLQISLDGDDAVLALELGLTRRGYNVLRDFEPGIDRRCRARCLAGACHRRAARDHATVPLEQGERTAGGGGHRHLHPLAGPAARARTDGLGHARTRVRLQPAPEAPPRQSLDCPP